MSLIHGTSITDQGAADNVGAEHRLHKSPDKSWFISANPSMTDLWIYARAVPSKTKLERMISKASELGYNVRKLEFPPH